jgi:DNA-binding transcriptional MocR family regulator
MRAVCRRQTERMRDAITRHFPPGTRVTNPAGGFLLWVEAPPHLDSLRLFDEALRVGISITPGPAFSARLGLRNCLRINCSHPFNERMEQAVATLGRLVAAQERSAAAR